MLLGGVPLPRLWNSDVFAHGQGAGTEPRQVRGALSGRCGPHAAEWDPARARGERADQPPGSLWR